MRVDAAFSKLKEACEKRDSGNPKERPQKFSEAISALVSEGARLSEEERYSSLRRMYSFTHAAVGRGLELSGNLQLLKERGAPQASASRPSGSSISTAAEPQLPRKPGALRHIPGIWA